MRERFAHGRVIEEDEATRQHQVHHHQFQHQDHHSAIVRHGRGGLGGGGWTGTREQRRLHATILHHFLTYCAVSFHSYVFSYSSISTQHDTGIVIIVQGRASLFCSSISAN